MDSEKLIVDSSRTRSLWLPVLTWRVWFSGVQTQREREFIVKLRNFDSRSLGYEQSFAWSARGGGGLEVGRRVDLDDRCVFIGVLVVGQVLDDGE